jgi:UDP-3-O-[3-hydroxymyristoyl] glucosamine N-acyltransferase
VTEVRLADLADLVSGRVVGDPDRIVRAVRPLESAGPDDLAVLHNPKYTAAAQRSGAGVILVREPVGLETRDLLLHDAPYVALARILETLYPAHRPTAGVHPSAAVDPEARLGDGVSVGPCAVVEAGARIGDATVIGPGCVVGRDAEIGSDCMIHPRVVVAAGCSVGDRCILQPGVVLGGDGFGFATADGVHHKVPQVGRVIVEDDVEIGANTAVDRGSLGDTVIGRGTKIDNLVMVAHNVEIGRGCLIAAQVGIAGSTTVGDGVMMGGQVGIAGHVRIGDGAQLGARSAVMKSVPEGVLVSGDPARPFRETRRAQAEVARIGSLRSRVDELERRLRALESATRDGTG